MPEASDILRVIRVLGLLGSFGCPIMRKFNRRAAADKSPFILDPIDENLACSN